MTINKIIFNSNNTNTDLCKLGSLFQSDKSPYNSGQWRHGYTPFYDILLSSMRYKEINIKLQKLKNLLKQDDRTLIQGQLGYLMATSKTTVPIPGAKTVAQIEENARILEFGPLSKDLVDQINSLFATIVNK